MIETINHTSGFEISELLEGGSVSQQHTDFFAVVSTILPFHCLNRCEE
jgi:hypothetical protein